MPRELLHRCTIFLQENVFTPLATARELRDLTGLELNELVALRPQRLALHELLVRVTADFSVPDGQRIEDLGINMRQITRVLLAECVEPRMDAIVAAYDATRRALAAKIDAELAQLFSPATLPVDSAARARGTGLRALLSRQRSAPAVEPNGPERERRMVAGWQISAHSAADALTQAAHASLAKVVSALLARHGRVWGSRELISALATDIACNSFGSEEIGRLIEPWLKDARPHNGFRLLASQQQPLVMNTKGPSASGKSTLRPLQRVLARALGVSWSEFALVSPDIWRKQLLDYDSLGTDYKYAGAFTGDELQIVDHKLDRHMARKAERGDMPHLLIDRFRFDSFAPDSDQAGSNLLTRFGHTLYLFFLVTPPESLVERAWNRGLEVGRYKAVDDTLAHGIEAYAGLPQVFFTWVGRTDKRVHFEFLDNSVRQGERPRTAAFGWNDELNVLDVGCLIDIERFRRVNIDARSPQALYLDRRLLAPECNTGFLRLCLKHFRRVDFAEQATGRVYLRLEDGRAVWSDPEAIARAVADPDTRASVADAAPRVLDGLVPATPQPTYLIAARGPERVHTVGSWGPPP